MTTATPHAAPRVVPTAPEEVIAWNPASRQPSSAGYFAAKERIDASCLTQRVLFTGNFWMTEKPVAAWRNLTMAEVVKHEATSMGFLINKASSGEWTPSAEPLATEPYKGPGAELASLQKLSGLELVVAITRVVVRPVANATGVCSGKVLAVSENFAAQHVGGNVIIHKNENLSQPLQPGQNATLKYENGKATVHAGLAHDIDVVAPWMPADQRGYLRMVMFDALSVMTEPQSDDDKLRDAMKYALESTANFFGIKESRLRTADIELVVNERQAVIKSESNEDTTGATHKSRRPG